MNWLKQRHWQILLGLGLGILFGILAVQMGWGRLVELWIAPFGTLFMNLLKVVAIPLVLFSLVSGVASLSDLRKLSRIGGKTIALYLGTTTLAITIGLTVVNVMKPGKQLPSEVQEQLRTTYSQEADERALAAVQTKERGPLQPLVDLVPENFFGALASNGQMLQVVVMSLLVGVALIQIPREKSQPVVQLFQSLTALVIHIVGMIMIIAPLGVFALMANTITALASDNPAQILDLLGALGYYCLAVLLGLLLQTFGVYPILIKSLARIPLRKFFQAMGPVQLVAFSTSSSGATLPVTMKRCEEKLGVSDEVSSFVLPLGATINMDGTALYQSVAAVFIAQALGMDLSLVAQLSILLTALLASIGTAAVPGAGIITLVIILEAIQVPTAGIALILGVDRILDMCRTATNVTGDATVASVVARSENQIF